MSFPDSLDRNEVIKLVIFIKKKEKKTSHSLVTVTKKTQSSIITREMGIEVGIVTYFDIGK